jgi:hypothetical protein
MSLISRSRICSTPNIVLHYQSALSNGWSSGCSSIRIVVPDV